MNTMGFGYPGDGKGPDVVQFRIDAPATHIVVHNCKDGASEPAVETGLCWVRALIKIYKDAHKSLLYVANCMHPDTDDCVYDTLKLLKSKIRELEQVCERENNDCTHCPNRLVIHTCEYTVGE